VNKARLVERIAQLVNDKDIEDISDIRDESDRDGMRIVVELKRGAEPQIVLNKLFKHTQMQESFSMILLAVVHGQPRELGLIPTIKYFIDHRVDVVRRRTAYLLSKARDREAHPRRLSHGARSFGQCSSRLSAAALIVQMPAENLVMYSAARRSTSTPPGVLQARSGKTVHGKQADAILELQLHRLTKLSIDEIANELKQVRETLPNTNRFSPRRRKLRV